MPKDPTELEEEDLLDDLLEFNPLAAIDADKVDRLSTRQRSFLVAFLNTGSIPAARKSARIELATWRSWQTDEHFTETFAILKDPLRLAASLNSRLQLEAALELMRELKHESVKVRQWAVEQIRSKTPALEAPRGRESEPLMITQGAVKELLDKALDAETQKLIARPPLQFVDAEVREIPN